jgi:hypothetical protein
MYFEIRKKEIEKRKKTKLTLSAHLAHEACPLT